MNETTKAPLAEWRANRTQSSVRAVGGRLALYVDRLEFRPHKFDRATGGGGWTAELGRIRSVGKQARGFNPLNGSLRERLRVETTRGATELFVVSPLSEPMKSKDKRGATLDLAVDRIRRVLPADASAG
jgi:hypothetical protein